MPDAKALPCVVCAHESLPAINQAIVNGQSRRGIARNFRIGRVDDDGAFHEDHHKISRHITKCMPDQFAAATTARRAEAGNAIMSRMDELDAAVNEVLERARKGTPMTDSEGAPLLNDDGSPVVTYPNSTILAAVRQGRANNELRAKLMGAVDEPDTSRLERQQRLLESAEGRRLLAEMDRMASEGDQTLTP